MHLTVVKCSRNRTDITDVIIEHKRAYCIKTSYSITYVKYAGIAGDI